MTALPTATPSPIGRATAGIAVCAPRNSADPARAPSSAWHPTGSDTQYQLTAPLAPYRDRCVFFRGVSMGPADAGSHPGGAKKLLTAVDGGNGSSIDQRLAQSIGSHDAFPSLLLGAMARQNNASGDKHVSYIAPGVTVAPDDDPVAAFARGVRWLGRIGRGPASSRELRLRHAQHRDARRARPCDRPGGEPRR